MENKHQDLNSKIDKADFKLVNFAVTIQNELVGKPQNSIKQIFKRFFRNPFYVFVFALLLLIILVALIGTYTSPYQPDAGIASDKINVTVISSLPPSSSPIVSKHLVDDIFIGRLEEFYSKYGTILGFSFSKSSDGVYTYNAYELLIMFDLDIQLFARGLNTNPPAELVRELASQIHYSSFLGTTREGYDIWTRTLYATLNSLSVAFIAATLSTLIGVSIGVYLGFHVGTWIDTVFLRAIEIFDLLPALIFFLIFSAILGTSFWSLIGSLLLVYWSGPVREARLFTYINKDAESVVAAQAVGASKLRRIYFHILPAILGKLVNSYVLRIPGHIFAISSLAFLGFLGGSDRDANLGNVINQAVSQFRDSTWALLFPALVLVSLTLSLQFIALGIHDALDPRLGKR